MSKFFAVLMLMVVLVCGTVMADEYDLAYKRLGELEVITTEDTGDKIVVWDATDKNVKTMDASTYIVSLVRRVWSKPVLVAGLACIGTNMFFAFPMRMTQTMLLMVCFLAYCEKEARKKCLQ